MKQLRSNLEVLIARHNQEAPAGLRRISKRSLARDLSISRYTIYALANNQLDEYPRDTLEKLCSFFNCDIGDLLSYRDIPDNA